MERPVVSVIITAQDRKEYLLEAVKSVVEQEISPALYEILVVKNFEDERIDRQLSELGVRAFLAGVGPVGQKHAVGLNEASGEIVSFLDDDDIFSSQKLQVVVDVFNRSGDIVYYHNGMCFDKSELLSDAKKAKVYRSVQFDSTTGLLNSAKLREFNSMTPNYNLSSMSFRKSFLDSNIKTVLKISRDIDFAWYMLSLESHKTSVADSVPLTYYRRHEEGTSRATSIEKINTYSKQAIESYGILESYLNDKSVKNLCSYYIEDWKAKLALLSSETTLKQKILETNTFMRKWKWRATNKWFLVVLFLLLVSIISGRAASSAYPWFFR